MCRLTSAYNHSVQHSLTFSPEVCTIVAPRASRSRRVVSSADLSSRRHAADSSVNTPLSRGSGGGAGRSTRQLQRGPQLGTVSELAQVEAQEPLDAGDPVPDGVPVHAELPGGWILAAVVAQPDGDGPDQHLALGEGALVQRRQDASRHIRSSSRFQEAEHAFRRELLEPDEISIRRDPLHCSRRLRQADG